MPIHKTTFTITVYSRDPYDTDADLLEVIEDITNGPCIGECNLATHEIVPADKVRQALIDIGNDGGFFDTPEGDVEDEDGCEHGPGPRSECETCNEDDD